MAKFYNDIDVKSNVIKNCDNFVEIKEYTEDEIANLFDMTPQEVEELISILNDNIISNSKIWSSKKIDDEIKLAITKSNKYTDSMLNKISSISLMYVSSLPTMDIKDNIIYILKSADGSSNDTLNIYDSTNSTWTSIGEFTISMENYVEKTNYDADMVLKANDNEVIHYNDIKTDLTSTSLTNTEVIGALSLKTELDNKAKSDDLTNHINDSVAHLTQSERDKILTNDDIATTIDSNSTNERVASAKMLYDNTKALKEINLISYVNTDLFDTTNATVNAIKCGRHVQLNIQALVFKKDMEGLLNLLVLNAIPEEYRPLILSETTMYTTTGNIAGRGFIDTNGVLYNFFYYDSAKDSPKIGGYLFGTFNYISAI